jgi:hypothetical protein
MASQPIYQFYAELDDYTPKIWRRFQVMNNITMARLGYIVMTMFEMQASHLFCFEVPLGENYNQHLKQRSVDDDIADLIPDRLRNKITHFEVQNEMTTEFQDEESLNAATEKLPRVIAWAGDKLSLQYDYGDGWEVKLVLEQIIEDKELPGKELPRVLAGEGYGIIEDCGGTGGLEDIAKAFKKKKGKQYNQYRQWLGTDELDLNTFDIDDMNFRLKKVPRIYSDIYEYGLEPTKQSIDLLTRKYLNR